MTDYYDRAVEYFCEQPDEIFDSWQCPPNNRYGYLFAFVTPDRGTGNEVLSVRCGCPSMIRGGNYRAHPSLNKAVELELIADERIPDQLEDLNNKPPEVIRAVLTAFAEWQRRIDKELGRKEPVEI